MSVWLPLLAGVLVALLLLASTRSGHPGVAVTLAAALTALLVAAEQWSAHFDGYDTDLWTYVLIAERAADGKPLQDRDPFLLQPPPTPHLSLPWLLAGRLVRLTGWSGHAVARGLGAVSAVLLTLAAVRVARRLFEAPRLRWTAVLLFWLGLQSAWATLPLGRTMALGFALLAVGESLAPGWSGRRAALAGAWAALAFYTHLFTGILALLGVGLAALSRVDGARDRLRTAAGAIVLSAVLALPSVAYAVSTLTLERSGAHVQRPGQATLLGLRYLEPAEILRMAPPSLLVLGLVGLACRPAEGRRTARRLAVAGTALWVLVVFSPAYEFALRVVGGWMPERLVHLAFLWVAATLAVESLDHATPGGGLRRALVALALLGLSAQAGVQVGLDLDDRPLGVLLPARENAPRPHRRGGGARAFFAMTAEAQAEARSLRPLMRDRWFVSDPLLAYGMTASTLGLPLAVPTGHASPFGDFPTRLERVRGAFRANSPGCWSRLFAAYPGLELLVTPAPGAEVENLVWKRPVGPEAVRRVFERSGALRPVFRGRFFVLDAIGAPAAVSSATEGSGEAELCWPEP